VKVERQGKIVTLPVRPELDKNTGAGRIGVYYWAEPIITGIVPESKAAASGLMPGDRIVSVNGTEINHAVGFMKALEANPGTAEIGYIRDGVEGSVTLALPEEADETVALGIIWPQVRYRTPALSPPAAVAKGAKESWNIFAVSLKSLSLLFKGINLTQAVSGPARITYMVGEVATEGFGQGFGTGLRSMAEFLALISIALAIMNLLPLPILDGGIVVLSVVEVIRRKPTPPKAIQVLQTVGITIILGIMIFAIFGDIMYFAGK
jgi:regulator of sigma E protease